jgi:hypothetical protein
MNIKPPSYVQKFCIWWVPQIQKPVHSCGRTAKATGFDNSFIFAQGTHFVPLKDHINPELALSGIESSRFVSGTGMPSGPGIFGV